MGSVTINGVTYKGNNVQVVNGKVTIDGKPAETGEAKNITIEVAGNVETLKVDECATVTVSGSAGSIKTMSGDVKCGDVTGDVETMSGDVRCGSVAGKVKTMSGDITHK